MQTIDTKGARLDTVLFISIYRAARKLSPPRFMCLRLHPDRYKELLKCAEPEECIELGPTPGPMGRKIMRITCVKPTLGVSDGCEIIQDAGSDPTKLIFEIHGICELQVTGLIP